MKNLLACLCIALPASPCARAEENSPVEWPRDNYSITNCFKVIDPAKTEKTKAGYQYWFADQNFADGKTGKLSVVGAGLASHPPHRHMEDEFFFVLEGTAEFYLDGERRVIGPMTSLYAPSWHEHGIRNTGTTGLKYLVMKRYPPKV